jgi:hypothetical protein
MTDSKKTIAHFSAELSMTVKSFKTLLQGPKQKIVAVFHFVTVVSKSTYHFQSVSL